jgi:phage gpG-like protein
MPSSYTITMHVGDVVRVLHVVEAAMDNPSDLMKDVLLVMIRSTHKNFEAQGRPVTWEPLSPATILSRLYAHEGSKALIPSKKENEKSYANLFDKAEGKKGKSQKKLDAKLDAYFAAIGSMKILRDWGLLWQSVGGNATGAFTTEDGFAASDDLTASIGTNRPGADALQLGFPGNNLPARPYILFQDEDEEDIADMAMDFMLKRGPYVVAGV